MFKYQNGCKKSFYVSSAFDLYEYVERLEMAFDIIKPLYNSLKRLTSKNICGRLRMHLMQHKYTHSNILLNIQFN